MNIENFDLYDFTKNEIAGVSIYSKNLPMSPCIHIRVVFNTGAFDDPVGKEGLSHFLEHMLLLGCPSIPDKKAVKKWSKINALSTLNAFTNFDNTWLTLKCLPEKYEVVLVGLKDMIFNSFIKIEDVETEKMVIVQEIWNNSKNEKFLAYTKNFVDNLFHGHVHERIRGAAGWPDTVAKITQTDIKSWHKNNYGIGNFFIVLAGAVEDKHIECLKEFLKDLPKVNMNIGNYGTLGKPKQKRLIKTADEIGEMREQVEISLIRVADKISYSENEIVNLSARLLRDLLNERLRIEHNICYSANAGVWQMREYSQAFMNLKTEDKNIELVEKEFKNILDEILNRQQTERFNLIKQMYIEQLESLEKLPADIMDNVLHEISHYNGHIITRKEQLAQAEKVSYEDVIKFIKYAFDPEYIYTEIILPSKK